MSGVFGAGSECSSANGNRGGRYLRRLEALEDLLKDYKGRCEVLEARTEALEKWKASAEVWILDNFEVILDPSSVLPPQRVEELKIEDDEDFGESSSTVTAPSNGLNGCSGETQNGSLASAGEQPNSTSTSQNSNKTAEELLSSTNDSSMTEWPMKTEPVEVDVEINIVGVRSLLEGDHSFLNGEELKLPKASSHANKDVPASSSKTSTMHSNGMNGSSSKSLSGSSGTMRWGSGENVLHSPFRSSATSSFSTPKKINQLDKTIETESVESLATLNGNANHVTPLKKIINPLKLSDEVGEITTPGTKRKVNSMDYDAEDEEGVEFLFASAEKVSSLSYTPPRIVDEDDPTPCDVCGGKEPEPENQMVFCEKCNVCVHQACYGVRPVPKDLWLCNPCKVGLKPNTVPCYLCPKMGGALKPVRSPAKKHWAHVACALWIPETKVANSETTMEPVTNINDIVKDRWKLRCGLCDNKDDAKMGCCIQCEYKKNCYKAFHVTCAMQKGLEMIGVLDEALSQGCSMKAHCRDHSYIGKDGNRRDKEQKKKSGTPRKKRKTEK